jgi:hypothetical protein
MQRLGEVNVIDLKAKVNSMLVGAAGEHFVVSQLLLQGIIAGLAPIGAKAVDVLTMSSEGIIRDHIQVKTARGRRSWHMGEKHEALDSGSALYAFVAFMPQGQELFLVPGEVVGRIVRESHQIWLDTPGVKGQQHNQTKMRMLHYEYKNLEIPCAPKDWMEQYRDAWELLSAD